MKNSKGKRAIKKLVAQSKSKQRKLRKTVKNLKARMVKVEAGMATLTKKAKAAKKNAQKKEAGFIKALKKMKASAKKKNNRLTKKRLAEDQKVEQLKMQLSQDEEVQSTNIADNDSPPADNIPVENAEESAINEPVNI